MESYGTRMSGGGFKMIHRPGGEDESVIELILGSRPLEAARWYEPRPDDLIIDVGAHIGAATVFWADRVPHGRVFAIEPSGESYALLRANVAINELENVQADRLALLDRAGEVRLHHSEHSSGHSVTRVLSPRGETVPAQSLSGYLDANAIERCDLMKLNCEGAEFPILLGSPPAVLRRVRRMLILWHGDLADDAGSPQRLERHLEDAGFALRVVAQSELRGTIFATLDR